MNFFRKHSTDERGASLVEYALLIAFIALACVGAVAFLGEQPNKPFSAVGNSLSQPDE
jgi:pilus assembly protein Flp/PilA